MNRLRYVLLGVLAAGVVAVVVVMVLGSRGHSSTAASLERGQVLGAEAKLAPQSLLFGAPVHVRIDAVIDRRELDPSRVHLEAKWTPYQPVTPLVRTTTNVGPYTRLHWAVDLHCVIVDCVPQAGSIARLTFQPTTVRYSGLARNGSSVDPVTVTWPEVNAVSRLDPIDLERQAIVNRIGPKGQIRALLPPWRVTTSTLAPVTYAISPGTVFWTCVAVALLLVVAAAFLLRPLLPGFDWVPRRRALSRLEQAVAAVEHARGGDSAEERKALELLAAELRKSGSGGLAWTATELAWSPSDPPAEKTGALTESVRRELAGRTNGHRA